jgi:hypothetical protein
MQFLCNSACDPQIKSFETPDMSSEMVFFHFGCCHCPGG